MSVFTSVSQSELMNYLTNYDVGDLENYEGISAGVENSNFFVNTDQGQFVLTLVESVEAERLPFILGLVDYLSENGLACAQPIHLNNGELFGTLNYKPAVLMQRLEGEPVHSPNKQQATVIGKALAKFHQLSSALDKEHYTHIPQWCSELASTLYPKLEKQQQTLIQTTLLEAGDMDWTTLPSGPVHADLFPDNAMFAEDKLTGLIDFYHSCSAPYLYDLCVTLNAWCYDELSSEFDDKQAQVLLDAYQEVRPLDPMEAEYLPTMMRTAALRFWLSRLRDYHFPTSGEQVTQKSPKGKESLLNFLSNVQDKELFAA